MTGRRTRTSEPLLGVPHGTTAGYQAGCGCDQCRDAQNLAKRAREGSTSAEVLEMFPDLPRSTAPKLPDWVDDALLAAIEAAPADGWEDDARCSPANGYGFGPDDFHPPAPSDHDVPPLRIRAHCDLCPVRADCIATALGFQAGALTNGWWGSSPGDRVRIRRHLAIRAAAREEQVS